MEEKGKYLRNKNKITIISSESSRNIDLTENFVRFNEELNENRLKRKN